MKSQKWKHKYTIDIVPWKYTVYNGFTLPSAVWSKVVLRLTYLFTFPSALSQMFSFLFSHCAVAAVEIAAEVHNSLLSAYSTVENNTDFIK
jgi:hypothetical protein